MCKTHTENNFLGHLIKVSWGGGWVGEAYVSSSKASCTIYSVIKFQTEIIPGVDEFGYTISSLHAF